MNAMYVMIAVIIITIDNVYRNICLSCHYIVGYCALHLHRNLWLLILINISTERIAHLDDV